MSGGKSIKKKREGIENTITQSKAGLKRYKQPQNEPVNSLSDEVESAGKEGGELKPVDS